MPPTASPSTTTTVQPVGRSVSVWWPTLIPSTAVSPKVARGAGSAARAAAHRTAQMAAHTSAGAVRFIALQYRNVNASLIDRVLAHVDRAADEIVQLTADLVRIPTVNPP